MSNVTNAAELDPSKHHSRKVDFVIVGTGAAGGTVADMLAAKGHSVVMLEEGPYKKAEDFKGLEREAYRDLFQEHLTRYSAEGDVSIIQGRCVGGGTTVNWCASFRTPENTINYWREHFGVKFDLNTLEPWFKEVETKYSISEWDLDPNENNRVIKDGAAKLGRHWGKIPRNVKDCADIGQCGTGCPISAKQGTMEATIPRALKNGAELIYNIKVDGLNWWHRKVSRVVGRAKESRTQEFTGASISIEAKYFILCAGAIGSPGIMLRSKIYDPYQRIGARTFLHPVNFSFAHMKDPVEGHRGTPQSIYSDHYLWNQNNNKNETFNPNYLGFKIEAAPVYPAYLAAILGDYGLGHLQKMKKFNHTQLLISLQRDGFHPESPGGRVKLVGDEAIVDYKLTPYMFEGFRRSFLAMAELQFAAGAERVYPVHNHILNGFGSVQEADYQLKRHAMERYVVRLGSAHAMGGCSLGEDPRSSVVNSDGKVHQYDNLYVMDGSVFPTSLGVNPQVTIFTLSSMMSAKLSQQV
jgi:choline dehydrogenase-like flavoprotein